MPQVRLVRPSVSPGAMADQKNTTQVDNSGAAIGRALQGLGQTVAQAGSVAENISSRMQQEELRRIEEANEYEANAALVAAQAKAGEAKVAFHSLQGAQASPAAYEAYRRDVENIYKEGGKTLSAEASKRYNLRASANVAAAHEDAGGHFTRQLDLASDLTRRAMDEQDMDAISADPGSAAAAQAMQALAARTDPRLPAEAQARATAEKISTAATKGIESSIKAGNLDQAQAILSGMGGRLLPQHKAGAELALKQATQDRDDEAQASQRTGGTMAAQQVPWDDMTGADLTLAEDDAVAALTASEQPQDVKDRVEHRLRNQFAELRQRRAAESSKIINELEPAMAKVATPAEADAIIQKAPAWAKYPLEQQARQMFAHLLGKDGKTKPIEDPVAIERISAGLHRLILDGAFKSSAELRFHAAGLPEYAQRRLEAVYEKGVPGLDLNTVSEAMERLKLIEKPKGGWDKETDVKAEPVHQYIRAAARHDQDVTPEVLNKLVAEYHTSVLLRDKVGWTGKEKSTLGQAVLNGDRFILNDPAVLAATRARMQSEGLNPDPTRTETSSGVPLTARARFWTERTKGTKDGKSGEFVGSDFYPDTETQVSTESDPAQVESDYYMLKVRSTMGYALQDSVVNGKPVPLREANARRNARTQRELGLVINNTKGKP